MQTGDVWTLGRHRMMCGDSTSDADVAVLMDGVKANLVVTDPPYNVSYESADGKTIRNDSMADGAFYDFLFAAFKNMGAHMAGRLPLYLPRRYGGLELPACVQERGLSHQRGACGEGIPGTGAFALSMQHEPVLFGWLPSEAQVVRGSQADHRLALISRKERGAPDHEARAAAGVSHQNSSAPNGVVLDLFGGSGSTLIACEQTDRICRTMELDPKYATVIVERYRRRIPMKGRSVALRSGRSYDDAALQRAAEERHLVKSFVICCANTLSFGIISEGKELSGYGSNQSGVGFAQLQ